MKASFLITVVLACLPVLATDEQTVTVTNSSLVKNEVVVKATLQGKPTEFVCFTDGPDCSEPLPGEYSMVRAGTAADAPYQDCTNVALYKSSGAARERVGVYCWPGSGDCYIVSPCSPVRVETFEGRPLQRAAPTLPFAEPLPPVLYPNPFRFSYPRSAQSGIVSGIGNVRLPSGKERIEVKLLADGGWLYVCTARSADYVRGLKRGDRVSIQPDEKLVHVENGGKRFRLKIIDVDRWGNL